MARTEAGTGMPARKSGAGSGSPTRARKGTTPTQAAPATSSAGSVGQSPEVFIDQSRIAAYNLVMDVASGRLDTADDIAAILQEATESRT
jgi:hypothetical protein